jgi:hypothetical protein
MSDNEIGDSDPIAEAFRTYRRHPKGIVPRAPRPADAMPIPTGPGQPCYVDVLSVDGVSRIHTAPVFVGTPIHSVEQLMERKRQREEADE